MSDNQKEIWLAGILVVGGAAIVITAVLCGHDGTLVTAALALIFGLAGGQAKAVVKSIKKCRKKES